MRGGAAGRVGREEASALTEQQRRLHESFLTVDGFRFLKSAALLSAAALVIYAIDRPYGSNYGGSWAGYTLGTVAALLILWLTWFGYRKRNYPVMRVGIASRLSAHVYFGLSLLIIATLHTGFHFGLNIHTLAYVLMCLVIGTGIVGVFCYTRYPRLMTRNRGSMTMQQMLGRIASLDDELRLAAMPFDEATAMVVNRAAETTTIGGSLWRQLSGTAPGCTTNAALETLAARTPDLTAESEQAWLRLRVLLEEKAVLLQRVRVDISYKAVMDLWLYFHVPLTFMLLAALLAHILSVFFLW
jgi:hypothetical protein